MNLDKPIQQMTSTGLCCCSGIPPLQVMHGRLEGLTRFSLCEAESAYRRTITGHVNFDKARSSRIYSMFNQVRAAHTPQLFSKCSHGQCHGSLST